MSLCDKCSAECRNKPMPGEVIIQCGAYKPPQTNADRIRAMSDEELAKALYGFKECSSDCPLSDAPSDKDCYAKCYDENTILDWLQQPAEGDK